MAPRRLSSRIVTERPLQRVGGARVGGATALAQLRNDATPRLSGTILAELELDPRALDAEPDRREPVKRAEIQRVVGGHRAEAAFGLVAAEQANLLRGHEIGCLPVLDGKKLVGIVTTTDMLDLIGRGFEHPIRAPKRSTNRKQRRTLRSAA